MQKRSVSWGLKQPFFFFFSAGISVFCLQSNKIHGTNLLEGFKEKVLSCILFVGG